VLLSADFGGFVDGLCRTAQHPAHIQIHRYAPWHRELSSTTQTVQLPRTKPRAQRSAIRAAPGITRRCSRPARLWLRSPSCSLNGHASRIVSRRAVG